MHIIFDKRNTMLTLYSTESEEKYTTLTTKVSHLQQELKSKEQENRYNIHVYTYSYCNVLLLLYFCIENWKLQSLNK